MTRLLEFLMKADFSPRMQNLEAAKTVNRGTPQLQRMEGSRKQQALVTLLRANVRTYPSLIRDKGTVEDVRRTYGIELEGKDAAP